MKRKTVLSIRSIFRTTTIHIQPLTRPFIRLFIGLLYSSLVARREQLIPSAESDKKEEEKPSFASQQKRAYKLREAKDDD